ncbi:MAG: helix-turn-helix domain-containing protein [Euryarchaeota archaeon]|jgi:hypothetical protein|nr:helix-turn-helix domain-containing protein [Euryarchaeota archaeon]
MSIIGEFHVSADDFVLAQTMSQKPDLRFELERFIPIAGSMMPYLWVGGNGLRSLQTATAADPTVENLRLIDPLNGGGLFHVEWGKTHQMVTAGCTNGDEALVQAVGQEDEWFLKIRFGTRKSLGSFQSYCDTHDIDFDLLRLYDIQAPKLAQYDMSARQRDAIVAALKLGYFDVPRNCALSDVAAELDLSVNAVSERIRRGEANMFRSALTIPRPPHRTDLQ